MLQILILRSPIIKNAFIELVSINSPIGPFFSSTHFSCYNEFPTEDEMSGKGRLDIVIELDNAIIGIENKLFAGFQSNQPEKYQLTLTEMAKSLTSLRKNEIQSALFILAPKSRKREIYKKLKSEGNIGFIAWEDVLQMLKNVRSKVNSQIEFLLIEFQQYLEEQISFLPNFSKVWFPHLLTSFKAQGTNIQNEFMNKMIRTDLNF